MVTRLSSVLGICLPGVMDAKLGSFSKKVVSFETAYCGDLPPVGQIFVYVIARCSDSSVD